MCCWAAGMASAVLASPLYFTFGGRQGGCLAFNRATSVKLVVSQLDGADPKSLPDVLDQLKNKIGSGIIVLGTVSEGKVGLIVGVTKDLTDRFHAGKLVNHIASQVGGKGGGRPDMARAGGSDPDSLPAALASVEQFARNLL